MARYQHDERRWHAAFKAAGDGTRNPDMLIIRALRKLIWLQTERELYDSSLQLSRALTRPFRLEREPPLRRGRCSVRVAEQDMLEVAGHYAKLGKRVAVLNMAAAGSPGGGFKAGMGAQEENLHRRSDAVRFTFDQRREHYPLHQEVCLISEDVTVFRGKEADGYPLIDPFRIVLLSCAAVSHPRLERNRYVWEEDWKLMQRKITTIVKAAEAARCEVAIFSAFGCGAFANPPDAVARMFEDALRRAELEEVVFCIIEDHNTRREHNPYGNVMPFRQVFGAGEP